MPDLDYVWMIFSQALHMESCTFIQIIYDGNPWHRIIRHTELKELSFEDVLNNYADTFPAALSDVLVLPNLVSLLINLEGDEFLIGRLLIILIVSLIMRSECRLTKLVLKASIINGSLITLLKETASLIHLEVHTLSPADIKSLTVDKTDRKQPITPCLHVIHLTKIDDIADPSLMNDLIHSWQEVDTEPPHLQPIQDMQLHFEVLSCAHQVYGKLHGLLWMPEYNGLEYGLAVRWENALRTLVSHRQTTIQVNFVDLYGSRVYVVCFISRPSNHVRKLLSNLWTLKLCRINILWYFNRLFSHLSHRVMNRTDLALVMGHLEGQIW